MNIFITVPNEGPPPLYTFFNSLDEKQRQKLFSLMALLQRAPEAAMREPYVKHFGIERYQMFYELRVKSRNLIRIIFTKTEQGGILFLVSFVKRHKRNTMQALDASLSMLAQVQDGSCSIQELSITSYLKGEVAQ